MNGSIRQRSPGSWEISIEMERDGRGRRRRKYFTVRGTKAVAQKRLRELLAEMDKGIPLPTDKVSVQGFLDRWMAEIVEPHRRIGTRERYRDMVERYLKPSIGRIELTRLAPSHVRALEAQLAADGLGVASIQLVHAVLSGAMKYAMQMELIARNPVSQVSAPAGRSREVVPPSPDAVRSILALAQARNHHLFPCIRLLVYTGMRRGEAMGLRWQDVDLGSGAVHITSSLVRTAGQGLILAPPKTEAGVRRVDLDHGTTEILRKHWEWQQAVKTMMGAAYEDQGVVFATETGDWLNPQAVYRAVQSLAKEAGYPGVTVRSLRHFHASMTLQQGQNVVVVSKRLGHSNVSITTDIYAHALPGWQRQAAEAFARAME